MLGDPSTAHESEQGQGKKAPSFPTRCRDGRTTQWSGQLCDFIIVSAYTDGVITRIITTGVITAHRPIYHRFQSGSVSVSSKHRRATVRYYAVLLYVWPYLTSYDRYVLHLGQ